MSVSRAPVTADQLSELPDDGRRNEVIDGVLFVTPAPSRIHQRAQAELHIRLHAYSKALGLEVLMAPTAVRASARTEVQPEPNQQRGSWAWDVARGGQVTCQPFSRSMRGYN